MPHANLIPQRLLVLFLTGVLLLFSPLPSAFARLAPWCHACWWAPPLLAYLFLVWAGLIGLTLWILSRR